MQIIETSYDAEESLEEVAKTENVTIELVTPNFSILKNRTYDLLPHCHFELFKSVNEALEYAHENYTIPSHANEDSSNKESSLILCQLGRRVGVYHASYQQNCLRANDQFDDATRELVREVLLFLLKKLEWIALRKQPDVPDTYFQCYFSTLRRYTDVALGRIIFDGKWISIISETPTLVMRAATRQPPIVDFSAERVTFNKRLPELLKTRSGCFVAIKDDKILDEDKDEVALARRVWSKTPSNVLIKRVARQETTEKGYLPTPLK